MASSTTTPTLPESFKAYVYTSHGTAEDQLKVRHNVPQTPLGPSQVRVKVHSAALNPVDCKVLEHGVDFIRAVPTEDAPFRIGFDAAGTVVEVGSGVNDDGSSSSNNDKDNGNVDNTFKVGDAVYAMLPFTSFGAVGEYVAMDVQSVAPKPANLDFDQAASVPLAALTSYQALATHANVQPGERVLVLGGSGGTGVFAVQVAKALGAHVTATTSFRNADFVKALGADRVIDYTTHHWADVLDAHSIDVVYDCGVEPEAWNGAAQRVLAKGPGSGRFVTILEVAEPVASPIGARFTEMLVTPSGKDLRVLTEWIEKGQIHAVVDSVHPFERLVGAMNRVKSARARGKVVVQVATE